MARRDYSSSDYSSRSRSRSRSRSSYSSRSSSRSRGRSPYSRRRRRSRSYSSRSYSSRSYSSRSYSSSSISVKSNKKPFWAIVNPITSNVSADHLKEICSMFGKVKQVILNKESGRFMNGYVEMTSQKDLSEVISGLCGGSIDGFTISVKEGDDPNKLEPEIGKGSLRKYSRSPVRDYHRNTRSPPRYKRRYSRSPPRYGRSRSPPRRRLSRSPKRYSRSRSPPRYGRSRSPNYKSRRVSRSPKRVPRQTTRRRA